MKTKLLIISIVLIAILSVSAVCAKDYENKGVKFNIPDGYSSSAGSLTVTTDLATEDGTMDLFKKGGDTITISVIPLKSGTPLDDLADDGDGFEKTTISGIDGYKKETPSGLTFFYIQDGKKVTITAPDADTIESIIVK